MTNKKNTKIKKQFIHFLFTLGNIVSFTLISYKLYVGFIVGVIAAIIGIYIFKKDLWLTTTQIFYLIINATNLFIFY